MEFFVFESFIGQFLILSKNGIPFRVSFLREEKEEIRKFLKSLFPFVRESYKDLKEVLLFFERYFKGEKIEYDLPFDLSELDRFSVKVLLKVKRIPYGEVRSYKDIAKDTGHPLSQRAVGWALKKNPLPIIIPCHRVIKKNGELGGFSFGIDVKKRLLQLEGIKLKEGFIHTA